MNRKNPVGCLLGRQSFDKALRGAQKVAAQRVIARTGDQSKEAQTYYTASMRKALAAGIVYGLGIPLSFVSSGIGLSLAGLVAVFWIVPWGPLDRLFLPKS